MLGLESLNRLVNDDRWKPTPYDYALHYFMEHGIGFDKFIDYPIPYILGIINTQHFIIEEQEKRDK